MKKVFSILLIIVLILDMFPTSFRNESRVEASGSGYCYSALKSYNLYSYTVTDYRLSNPCGRDYIQQGVLYCA